MTALGDMENTKTYILEDSKNRLFMCGVYNSRIV